MKYMLLAALLWPFAARSAALPPSLQTLQGRGGVVGQSFPGPDGLTGWVVKIEGHSLIVYTTPSGNYALSGILIDRTGLNLTQQYIDQYIGAPEATKLAEGLAKDPSVIGEGDPKAPLVYVYADANCIYCNRFWNETRGYVKSGKLQLRWVLLGFLKGTSPGRAAAILAAPDRLAALAQDEDNFDTRNEEGGIAPLDHIPTSLHDVLAAHLAQMGEAGSDGTPLLIYQRGGQWTLSEGLPPDMAKFVGTLQQPPGP